MTNFAFNNMIPESNNNPSDDQPGMLVNNQSNQSIWAIDHHGFGDNLGGYHTNIHQDAQLVDPAAIVAPTPVNQTYVKSVTPVATVTAADTQLFTRTALGDISQITGYKIASYVQSGYNLTEGYQWMGGILYQWGYFLTPSINGITDINIVFKNRKPAMIEFPNNCFQVTPVVLFTTANEPSTGNTISPAVAQDLLTKSGFRVSLWASTSKFIGISWTAIGN